MHRQERAWVLWSQCFAAEWQHLLAQLERLVPAAGKSSRFSRNRRKKPFVDLKGRAVWIRAVEHFV